MGYKKTAPTIYVVAWAADRIVKVGYSDRQRWRPFVLRGAEVVDLIEFESVTDAFDFESWAHGALLRLCERAFSSAADAAKYLGNAGGGWKECYVIPAGMEVADLLAAAASGEEASNAR
ncbi:hypothetical protein [Prescottella equi]|uniref:hypothetical protein n=1 Tax=Rhodococcus hoagii TaxID=43767 RepID=UPI000D0F63A2|nr:hypothetical protein [Prescottella equi]AVP67335.1 hypothetical protein C7H75_04845 [Prescottella equi]AVP67394.1 hypothetical protein C7H75_05165 [Prescottella equi]